MRYILFKISFIHFFSTHQNTKNTSSEQSMGGGRKYLSSQLKALYCIPVLIKLIAQQGRKSAEFQKYNYFLNYSENANFTKKL